MTISLEWACDVALNGRVYEKIPFVISTVNDCVTLLDAPTDWFRKLAISGNTPHTIDQYAFTLVSLLKYLERRRTSWRELTTAILDQWRNGITKSSGGGVTNNTWNQKLVVIYNFYQWAQEYGYVSDLIGEPVNGRVFPITISMKRTTKGVVITSELYKRRKVTYRPVPTGSEMEDAYAQLGMGNLDLATRNVLMMRWGEEGLRRSEFAKLQCACLPSMLQVENCERTNQPCAISVVGKGGKARTVRIDPEVVRMTIDYIDVERAEVFSRVCPTIDHGFIFVSHTSFKPLNLQYISRLLSKAFINSSHSDQLTVHRARARHLCKIAQIFIDEHLETFGNLADLDLETILFRVAQEAGHSDLKSLRYYLRGQLKSRIQRR